MSDAKTATGASVPGDLVLVGYVAGAFGLNGWVRIRPYSADASALLSAKTWWLDKPEIRDVDMLQSKLHSGDVVAQLMGVASREAAEAMRGTAVSISRARFPALADNEFYWVDLIGLDVENLQGEMLGRVDDMLDNGAHPVLKVSIPSGSEAGAAVEGAVASEAVNEAVGKTVDEAVEATTEPLVKTAKSRAPAVAARPQLLIPFVDQVVKSVDRQTRKITVDWGLDY